ncbi:3-hydroxyacyl-CoA dehydrogenase NAD-binding domain-containing protein [Acuticoccus sp. I52.16.1]|uniref:3-hydroxyacyl-CoA dehydrogenase NAD-binding domain-containing protein n=1 Tax=Acuticoccus sp. I52.16.1 TaxID=2928472 RepID=UPI001FD1D6FC|nr:3-hydroxyacyl-CoA dehydrogenase NAD-binding domain-containing protein [Acuticoccus sp. I52.16.1]UOM37261.1 3-hydroxyacyl-CoA dehydrogenase NAD-binding domain-containing protein [Acuticoccus sp. I52.16.1]
MIRSDRRGDGVLVLTWDLAGHATNVLSAQSIERFGSLMRAAIADVSVRGIVVASAKRDFLAGADLTSILPGTMGREPYAQQIRDFHRIWRDIETGGKPVVAALNGTTLGGGFELALCCHRRIAADVGAARIGLPEVTLGLIPGGGGTQRLPRLIGLAAALPVILEGRTLRFAEAHERGMIDELVAPDALLERACVVASTMADVDASQPWDRPGFTLPGGMDAAAVDKAEARMLERTRGLQTAPRRALASMREGAALPIEAGLELEAEHFVACCFDPQAANFIRTNFFGIGAARKLAARPEGVDRLDIARVGVLGAGMMGAGIAQVAAAAGIEVVLVDATAELATRGRDKAGAALGRQVAKGIVSEEQRAATLGRIHPTDDFAALAGVDLVVEAVFEDRAVKADVTGRAIAVVGAQTLFASNTSTLPITGLAEASPEPANVIGVHFFSPVDRMSLVEVILGEKTSETALAHALDFVRLLRKTPIVVRDGRGFYTSRVFATYIYEALEMLEEGIAPDLVEAGGLATGLPLGPLALSDELSIELAYRVLRQEREDTGDGFVETAPYRVCRLMVDTLGRPGRKSGAGYYAYDEAGGKRLWPGLAAHFAPLERQPAVEEIAERFLAIQSLEALRCLEDGILARHIDADIGAVLGWGYPAFRGGPVGHVHTVGPAAFLSRCEALARTHGPRFDPPQNLRRAATGAAPLYDADPSELR